MGDQAQRQILSSVRSAGHRVQRLRQRHLRVGQAARAVRITPSTIRSPTSPAASSRAPAMDRPSRTNTETGGTPARRGSATTGRSSGGSTCSRPSSRQTARCACSSRFQDFPQYMPTQKVDDIDSLFTGWMLLSYRKPATASSTMGEFAADRVDGRKSADLLGRVAEQGGRDADRRSRRAEDCARGAGQLCRLQVRPLRRRSGHLHRVRAPAFARRPELAAAREAGRPASRPAERLSRAAAAGAHALRPLCPRPCRRGEPGDQRPSRVRQC